MGSTQVLQKLFNDNCYTVQEAWAEWKHCVEPVYRKVLQRKAGVILGRLNNKAIARNTPLVYCISIFIEQGRVTEQYALAFFENVRQSLKMPLGAFRNAMRIVFRMLCHGGLVAMPHIRFHGHGEFPRLTQGWETVLRNSRVSFGQFVESISPFLTAINVSIFKLKEHIDQLKPTV